MKHTHFSTYLSALFFTFWYSVGLAKRVYVQD